MAKPAFDQRVPETSGLMGLTGKEPPREGLRGLEQERGPGAHERLGCEHYACPSLVYYGSRARGSQVTRKSNKNRERDKAGSIRRQTTRAWFPRPYSDLHGVAGLKRKANVRGLILSFMPENNSKP